MGLSTEASERLNLQLPDLASASCLDFSLTSDLSSSGLLSDNIGKQIERRMLETAHVRSEGIGSLFASYGSSYMKDDSIFVVAGTLRKVVANDVRFGVEIEHLRAPSNQPPPPADYKPISEMLEITSTLLGESAVNCQAQFGYELEDTLQSRIKLPSPMLLGGQNKDYGLTHIESAVFSRRENEGVEHTIEVIPMDDDRILHIVAFRANIVVNLENLGALFNMLVHLSQDLLDIRKEIP